MSLNPGLIKPATTLFQPYASQPIPSGPYTATYGTVAAGTTTNQQTLIHNVAIGDALVVSAQSNSATTAAVSVSDSKNNSYQLVSFSVNRSPNLALFVCFVTTPMVAGVDSITVTHASTATIKSMIVRGSSGFVCIDTVANPADGSSSSPSNSLPALGAVGDWVVSGLSNAAGPGMPVSWSGSVQTVTIGPGPFLTTADIVTSSTSPQTISAVLASSGTWELQVVALSPVPLVNQQTPLLIPPGINSPNSVNLIVPYVSFPGANVGGNSANVTVSGQVDNSVLDNVIGTVANVSVSGQSDNTITELIDGTGAVANVNVVAPAGTVSTGTSAPSVPFSVQFPFSPLLPPSLVFNNGLIVLRQQYSTALPDVFVQGSVVTVNVFGQADNTVADIVTGTVSTVSVSSPSSSIAENVSGATSAISVSAPAGSLSITTITPPQFPFSPLLPAFLRISPAYSGLRQQFNTALPDVFITGNSSSVSVSSAPNNSVTENITGAVSLVNSSAPSGSLSITTSIPPQFPQPPVLPNSIRFIPAFSGLRVQYNTGTPITLGGVAGPSGQVNVTAQTGQVSVLVSGADADNAVTSQAGNVLANVLGTVSSISVSAINSAITETLTGVSANINTAAISGNLLTTISGSTSVVTVAAIPGSIPASSITVAGVTATVNIAAISGGFFSKPFPVFWWRVYPSYGDAPVW